MEFVFKYLHWSRVRSVVGASVFVPPLPGVYGYAEVVKMSSLPIKVDWVYIGRALDLSKRLSQHEDLVESNLELRRWLYYAPGDLSELWYALVEREYVEQVEKALIRELEPKFNRLRYHRRIDL